LHIRRILPPLHDEQLVHLSQIRGWENLRTPHADQDVDGAPRRDTALSPSVFVADGLPALRSSERAFYVQILHPRREKAASSAVAQTST